jgi:hypothetical protein
VNIEENLDVLSINVEENFDSTNDSVDVSVITGNSYIYYYGE